MTGPFVWVASLLITAGAAVGSSGGSLYRSGSTSPAFPGESAVAVQSSALPCAGCHGLDARGGREGGLNAPPIDAATLLSHTPIRPPYDLQSFEAALHHGRGAGNRRLDPLMPRYRLSRAEVRDLWSYLGRVAREQRQGVEARLLRLAVPASRERLADAERLAKRAQQLWDARAVRPFGRTVLFQAMEVEDDPESAAASLSNAPAFAVLFAVDPDGGLHRALARHAIPSLFPLTALQGDEDERLTVGLFASRADQVQALLSEASEARLLVDDEGARFARRTGLNRPLVHVKDIGTAKGPFVVLARSSSIRRLPIDRLDGATLLGLADEVGGLASELTSKGARLKVSDPRPASDPNGRRSPDLERLITASVDILHHALGASARDLTRSTFIQTVQQRSFAPADWPLLDYRRFRLTGSNQTAILELR